MCNILSLRLLQVTIQRLIFMAVALENMDDPVGISCFIMCYTVTPITHKLKGQFLE